MTQKMHTDIAFASPATSAAINAPLQQLDAALADLQSQYGDFVVLGGLAGSAASLVVVQPACRAFVINTYVSVAATTLSMGASKDNYVDLDSVGAYHVSPVNNGAGAPAVFANSIRLYKAVASASAVTSIVDLRPTSAADPTAVHLAGPETITGAKTFSGGLYGRVWDNGGAAYHIQNFGAQFDGVTDDRAAWQAFANFITNKSAVLVAGLGARGVVGPGVSIISVAIDFPMRPGWSVHGAGRQTSAIRQATDNVPIFHIGSDLASSMHSWGIDGLQFDYVNNQPSTNTAAVPIHFDAGGGNQTGYEGYITNCIFQRGFYGIDCAASTTPPFGCFFNMLLFNTGLTGGAIKMGGGYNLYGHMWAAGVNMVGPIFSFPGGLSHSVFDNISCTSVNQGAQLLNFDNGSSVSIGEIGLENGVFSASQTLILGGVNTQIRIGYFNVSPAGLTFSGAGVVIRAIAMGGGSSPGGSYLEVGTLDLNVNTVSGGAVAHALQLGGSGRDQCPGVIGEVYLNGGWDLSDFGSTITAAAIWVKRWNMGWQNTAIGDADYTVVLGDPNKFTVETTFTAIRSFNLPAVMNNMHAGLYYEFRFYGAINGANTALIKCNGATIATLATDKVSVGFSCSRRNPASAQANWIMTKYEVLP